MRDKSLDEDVINDQAVLIASRTNEQNILRSFAGKSSQSLNSFRSQFEFLDDGMIIKKLHKKIYFINFLINL